MSVSYPYFSVAKKFGVPYSYVLWFIDIVESKNLNLDAVLNEWEMAALKAWSNECSRRAENLKQPLGVAQSG